MSSHETASTGVGDELDKKNKHAGFTNPDTSLRDSVFISFSIFVYRSSGKMTFPCHCQKN